MEREIFECKQCGYCCHGETTVSLDDADLERMVDYLKMPVDEVKKKYLRVTGTVVQMKIVDGHCIFFDNGCTIHSGKPWRCTQWPLHPSILADPANFQAISTSCPGINSEMGYEEFCRIFSSRLKEGNGR
ncbi:MAG: Fe-S oxidoreductase [Desulfobulbaceae bacterium DB1]|nr:MAG: Fe-S oxidoreductase [Desulfobulbaceae bacterium DB1]